MQPRYSIEKQSVLTALKERDFRKNILCQALLWKNDEQKDKLFALARKRRDECFRDREVEVRSVIEISNLCRQRCNYCIIGVKSNEQRYLISHDNFVAVVEHIYSRGRRVLLVQSGENDDQTFVDHICRCVYSVKSKHNDLVIILCLGNLSRIQYRQLKESGAERYILKFETSNRNLYRQWKPRDTLDRRLECLENLLNLGFAVGSGNMVGLPGQSIEDIVNDLFLLGKYKLAMSSCTVFIPGEGTEYQDKPPGDLNVTLNTMALMRIMYPDRLIPTTSSLEKLKSGSQYLGLMAGANTVTIHDGTPKKFKSLFPIYSSKRFTPKHGYIEGIVRKANMNMSKGALK